MKLPNPIKIALNTIKDNGYEAYVVGGAVRDFLLGKTASDFDLATNAKPEVIISLFKKYNLHTKGLKHGTVTVFINRKQIEITTFRIDEEYLDNRHPKAVRFVNNLYEDLARRDFTINALAYNEKIFDYFGGSKDLEKCVIRCVGDPNMRFNEDALRILRALRFAAQLNFTIEKKTSKAIIKHRSLLKNISSERIIVELDKMLLANIETVLVPYFKVFKTIIPELEFEQTKANLKVINNLPQNKDLRLAALLYKISNPKLVLKRLKYSNKVIRKVLIILNNLNIEIKKEKKAIKKILLDLDIDDFKNILEFKKAQGLEIKLDEELEAIKNEDYALNHLKIKGSDLIALGVPKTEQIAIILRTLILKVIDEEINNDKDDLIRYVNNIILNNKD